MLVRRSFLILIALAALTLAACSSDDGGGSSTGAGSPTEEPSSPSPTGAESPSPTESPSSGVAVELETEDSALGTILTDGEGRTLYVFLNDQVGGASTCAGDCAASWPAFTTTGEVQTSGNDEDATDPSLIGTIAGADGAMQVTYAGRPLYYFAGDQAAGDTNGQGVGDIWFVVSAKGKPVKG
jgi:predicted lipoprotein with Yx(FWY)xxD motif